MTMTTPTAVRPAPAGVASPMGSQTTARRYIDTAGKWRNAAYPVPVDQYGRCTSAQYACRRCRVEKWVPQQQVPKGMAPQCETCERAMSPVPIKRAPWLPWKEMAAMAEQPFRPAWVLAALAGVGAAASLGGPPAVAIVGAAPVVGELARRIALWLQMRRDLDADADSARRAGYVAGAATALMAVPASVDVFSPEGFAISWGAFAAAWVWPAGRYWKRERDARNAPNEDLVIEDADSVGPKEDADEKYVRLVWAARMAAKQGQQVVDPDTGLPVPAERPGKLPGSYLEDWKPIEGGWSATVHGPIGAFESDQFAATPKNIAAAYRMHRSMVTVMPDPEDENRAIVMAQKSSPLKDMVRWPGPDSIDAEAGTAVVGRYADGTPLLYELYRPGWGCPHDFLCGTTGAGKSETLSGLLIVDRYASHVGPDGVRRGLVADLLIDPQQGQSYEPFMDDLAAPVATSLEEAFLLVEAVRAEMFRRNAYLSKKGWKDKDGVLHRAQWVDKRGRTRYGRKWWNPLIDGPLITLNIDEAHEYLKDAKFAALVTAGARMYRKTGIRIRIATHTPLLQDLGGSMPLRDMLTGGFVWVGRTANALTGSTAFNGRLPVDPRAIPAIPGAGFTLGHLSNKPMMSRFMWEPDYYDLVRDENEEPIGFPAELPAHTLEAFGPEYAKWAAATRSGEDWTPDEKLRERIVVAERAEQTTKSVDAVFDVLARSTAPLDMNELDAALEKAGTPFSTRTVRDALAKLRERGLVFSVKGRHELTPQARAERDESSEAQMAGEQEQLALDAEGGEW